MAQRFLTSIDLGTNELIRPRIHNLTTANQPATGDSVEGQIYFNTTSKFLKVFDGTNWNNIGATYSTSVVDSTGIKLRLTGSDGTTDDVLFSGTHITVSSPDASTINFALPQSIATDANPTFAGATLDLVTIGVGVDGGNLITTTSGKLDINAAGGGGVFVLTDLTISGNLVVNGDTITVQSTTLTVKDPIITLGGDTDLTADDNKDRGVEFRWHDGTNPRLGFFGFDDSSGRFKFIPYATNSAEVFSGSPGDIEANTFWGALQGNASSATEAGNVTGTVAIANGGTGGTTASAARTNLGVASFKQSIGDGSTTSFVITHNLNTIDVIVQLYDDTTVNDTVYADVQRNNVNYITVLFNSPPSANQIRVLIMSVAG